MSFFIIKNIKKQDLKFGGSVYVNRIVKENDTEETKNIRREIVKARKGDKFTIPETDIKNNASRMFEALKSGSKNELYGFDKSGTEEDIKDFLDSCKAKKKNVFDDMDLLVGDQIIFIPFFGYYKHDLIDNNEIEFSLIVNDDKGMLIGTLIPTKIVEDAMEYKKYLSVEMEMN